MCRLLRSDRLFSILSGGTDLASRLAKTVHKTYRNIEVSKPEAPAFMVSIETKEQLIARLFCPRLGFRAALEMDLLRVIALMMVCCANYMEFLLIATGCNGSPTMFKPSQKRPIVLHLLQPSPIIADRSGRNT